MAVPSVATERPLAGRPLTAAAGDLFASTISSALAIAFCLSYAALIFSGSLTPWLGYGISLSFLCAAIGGFLVSWRSSVPFILAAPDSATSAVTATLAAATVEHLHAHGLSDPVLAPVVIVMALSALFAGIALCGLGFSGAGRLIRFVPYPVIGGFLGASGWLIVSGAAQVTTDHTITLANLDALTAHANLVKLLAAAGIAVALLIARHRMRSAFALPAILAASMVAVDMLLRARGFSVAEAEAQGWTFAPQPPGDLIQLWSIDHLRAFPWRILPSLSGDLFAVVFVTVISMLLNVTGIEFATRREADLDRELNALGIANAASGAFGGYVSCVSLSRSIINYGAGARGRLAGFIVATVSAAMLATGPGFLAYVPKCALGGLLLYIGFELVYRWLIASWRQLLVIEYVSLAGIALIIINWGFVPGVLIGVVIGCATFALNASRVNAIKFSFDGTNYRSSLDRAAADLMLLNEQGQQIQGMSLQSYLFFGSANRLYQHIKSLLAEQTACRFLVFDFRLVTGIDSSATHSFRQIKHVADEQSVKLVLVNLSREVEQAFRATRFISHDIVVASDLDHALEACENEIIAALRPKSRERASFEEWLTEALGSASNAAALASHCDRIEVPAGGIIARRNEAGDSMHFIVEGRVGIIVKSEDGRPVRVRSLGPHTTIGEMGLLGRRARSATIEAEVATVLYELSLDTYERIKTEDPDLSHALLNYVVSVMSERLSFANRAISVLQR
jgi:SulP family sulfate permease